MTDFPTPSHILLKEAKLNAHYAVHAAELLGDFLSGAAVQKVPQDLCGAEEQLSRPIRLIHMEADLLSSSCSQDQTTVHRCNKAKHFMISPNHTVTVY